MTAPSSIDPACFLHEHLASASPDLLRSMLTMLINTLMSAEADAICGAPCGQASPDRGNVRNGYRHRDTRAGTLDVAIPKLASPADTGPGPSAVAALLRYAAPWPRADTPPAPQRRIRRDQPVQLTTSISVGLRGSQQPAHVPSALHPARKVRQTLLGTVTPRRDHG
jgi:hypothetical protein